MQGTEVQDLVREVIRRLAHRLAGGESRGEVICVFTGATVGLGQVLPQLTTLVLRGYGLRLVLTPAARSLYGNLVDRELAGLPRVAALDEGRWLMELKECAGVAAPLLSVNTLSLLTALQAPNLASNLLLHGLFLGKPVILAADGADPMGEGREALGFTGGTPALARALAQRLETAAAYGCRICRAAELAGAVSAALDGGWEASPAVSAPASGGVYRSGDRVLTARQVLLAAARGCGALAAAPGALITDLAREEAGRRGITIQRS